jgi:adenylate cyclase
MNTPTTRQGSVLFTDLVGFTDYTDACGDVAALDVLDQQAAIVQHAIAAVSNARVVKELGDGLMLWFERAAEAVTTAEQILVTVGARRAGGFPLAVRMGVHCGEVIERGDDFVGQTVNIAARVADLAGPGELLASEPVVRSLDDQLLRTRFRPVGPTRVKGVGAPIWLHRLARDVSPAGSGVIAARS